MEAYKHTSLVEEIVNSVTHGLGFLLAIIGVILLTAINMKQSEYWRMLGISIFGISVILTYASSTFYHSFYYTKAYSVFRKLDQSSIFLLISGTYTPFILIYAKNTEGLLILLFLWILATLGVIHKTVFGSRLKKMDVIIYLSLGWIGIPLLWKLILTMPQTAILLLIAGGCFYTFGTIFCVWKSLKFNHGIWHLFVLFGTISHSLALLYL